MQDEKEKEEIEERKEIFDSNEDRRREKEVKRRTYTLYSHIHTLKDTHTYIHIHI